MNLSHQEIVFSQHRVAYFRDEDAYRKLFFYFFPGLHRLSVSYVKSFEIAEELVSDVMMKVWDFDHKLAEIDNLKVYLFTSIRNASLSYLSKNKISVSEIDLDMEQTISDKNNNPEDNLMFMELQLHIEDAVSQLPERCQMIYRLVKEQGLSHKEVCSILEITQNTIETQIRIALKKIKAGIDRYQSAKK